MEKTLLIVDDSSSIRESLIKLMKPSSLFSLILEAENGTNALEILLKKEIHFVISDVVMPHLDGYKLLSLIRNHERYHDLPFILLTSKKDSKSKIKGISMGASDFVTKPFDQNELMARVKNLLQTKSMQEELRRKNHELEKLNQKLKELSVTDSLTNLYNRRFFNERLSIELQRSKRYQLNLACLLLDLDHFKTINDTFGHQKGDHVLQEVAHMVKSLCRSHDVAARFGGEEFILFLCQTHKEAALKIAERIRGDIESFPFLEKTENSISITVSIGVSGFPHPDIQNVQDMIQCADEALYSAKRAGRNKVIWRNGN